MRLLSRFASLTLLLALCGCWNDDISGTYVGGSGQEADLIQVVQGTDGHLTGRFAFISMKPDGETRHGEGPVDGAYRAGNVVVTLHIVPALGAFTLSGTADAGKISLAGGAGPGMGAMTLTRSDEADFEARADRIRHSAELQRSAAARVAALRAAHEEAAWIAASLRSLIEHEEAFKIRAARLPGGIVAIETRYRSYTAQMRAALERQRSIAGDGQATLARGQISLAINQVAMEANQFYAGIRQQLLAIVSEYGPVVKDAEGARGQCSGTPPYPELAASCGAFLAADGIFRQQIAAEKAGFAELQEFFSAEKARQDQLQQNAQNSVNRI